MTVLFLGPIPPPRNGASVVTAQLLSELQQRGVVCHPIDVSDERSSRSARLRTRLAATARATVSLMRRHSPSWLYLSLPHSMSMLIFLPPAVLARLRGCRVVFHHHTSGYLIHSGLRMIAARLLFRAAGPRALHIVLGPTMAADVASMTDQSTLRLGNPFCSGPAPDPDPVGAASAATTIGHLSNLTSDKGVELLADAFRSWSGVVPDGRLVLAGPCCDETARCVVEQLRTSPAVSYLGAVEPVERDRFLSSVHAFVFPSLMSEAQPMVILEALRAGVPVVATDVGYVADAVGDAGVVVRPDRWADDAVAAIQVVSGERNAAFRERATRRYRELYRESTEALDQLAELLRDPAR